MKNLLPEKLQNLVSWSVALLGQSIKEEFGEKIYAEIEQTRRQMKSIRHVSPEKSFNSLLKVQGRFSKLPTKDLYTIAHSYALMLELINSCEIAYRTHRVQDHKDIRLKKRPYAITYVLTAHPTEARSNEILKIFAAVQDLLREALIDGEAKVEERLVHLLKLCLYIPMASYAKPSVRDEAESIYSMVLRPQIINELIHLKKQGIPVYFRAWVGGDKDGHPGVNEVTMRESLELSRSHLLNHVQDKLLDVHKTLILAKDSNKTKGLDKKLTPILKSLSDLYTIAPNDGKKVKKFYDNILGLYQDYARAFGVIHPDLNHVKELLWIFPALVLPLEVREDSAEVKLALKDRKMAIAKMLRTLKEISNGHEARWYVRGLVLSMVESSEDLINGLKLAKANLGKSRIPVVPLFENEVALRNSLTILKETFQAEKGLVTHHQKAYQGRFEVMLGYSDSSKENGVFTSRYMISKTLFDIDKLFKKLKLTPVFFHGSGGSVERGGGSVREQTAQWPESAVYNFKVTTQGEMVARTFANEILLRRQVEIISSQLMEPRAKSLSKSVDKTLHHFSEKIRERYTKTVADDNFFEIIEKATPYSFLQFLKIGSRPTKRSSGLAQRKLRAIPWILCWTQTRTLFPTWWGVGSSFSHMSEAEKWRLKEAYTESAMFRSFVKVLGFTLSKVELGVWRLYLESSKLSKEHARETYKEFKKEYELAVDFVKTISGEKQLLWFRPWLAESIYHRSSMIHPLNIIQLEALKRKELGLLRESVTGIACGMLTTG